VLVRVIDGASAQGPEDPMMGTGALSGRARRRVFTPKMIDVDELGPGEVGFITARSRKWPTPRRRHDHRREASPTEALPGFKPAQPVVFCGLFPVDAAEFEDLRAAMGKLRLNDASFSYEMESSAALGFGFRCGFLGLLHLEIIQERWSASSTST
jgi:GTP-binding protein LepA